MTNENETKADSPSLIDSALSAAERLEKANKEFKELLDRQEKINTRIILGGGSEAGKTAPKPIDPQEQVKQEVKAYFKGTEIERYFSS